MTVWAFDVDETLEISAGPVLIQSLKELKDRGDIVGICGNWAAFCQRVANWHELISFMNAGAINKESHLAQLRMYVPADEFVFVGNILGVSGASDDKGAVDRVNQALSNPYAWRFIKESDFAQGAR